ncbi:hypothetical protein ACSTK0_24490, partial [Vibrio parahaemolyticus]
MAVGDRFDFTIDPADLGRLAREGTGKVRSRHGAVDAAGVAVADGALLAVSADLTAEGFNPFGVRRWAD